MGQQRSDRGVALVGGEMLQLITAGMYSDPLAVYREYLQNAADTGALQSENRPISVRIRFDLANERVTIRDDGAGLSRREIRRNLLPVGRSRKTFGRTLGFRGIGRLAGLAFARSVTFVTRDKRDAPVTRVHWDGQILRSAVASGESAEATIGKSVAVETLPGDDYPERFFEVSLDGISRAASGALLNRDRVATYISQVCAVPFSSDFPFAAEVKEHVLERVGSPPLEVYLDDSDESVLRPHRPALPARSKQTDSFSKLETIRVPTLDGEGPEDLLAVGWIAHSSYYGALPEASNVRGLRARIRDFQVGGDGVFAHLFSEPRFNQWCVAEVHIVDSRLRPNGRRDYFEPSPHLRHLENQLRGVCRGIEKRCRVASRERNSQKRVNGVVLGIQEACDFVRLGYLTAEASEEVLARQHRELEKIGRNLDDFSQDNGSVEVDAARNDLQSLRDSVVESDLPGIAASEQSAYRKAFSAISAVSTSPREARRTIEAILEFSRS